MRNSCGGDSCVLSVKRKKRSNQKHFSCNNKDGSMYTDFIVASCMTGISLPCLGFPLPQPTVAETRSTDPPPPSSARLNGRSDDCCVSVGGTDTEGPVFALSCRIALQLWASPFTTVTFAFLPSIEALSSEAAEDTELLPIDGVSRAVNVLVKVTENVHLCASNCCLIGNLEL